MSNNPGETPTDEQEHVTAPGHGAEDQEHEEEDWDPARARAVIAKLRAEAKQHLKDLKEYDALKRQREQKDLSETEKVSKRMRELEAERDFVVQESKDRALEYAIEREASKSGIVDPEAARMLLDRSQLEFDEQDRPTNVGALLKALVKAKPWLAQQTTGPAMSATNGASRQSSAQSGRRYTRAEILDRNLWNTNKDDIMKAIREQRID